MSNLDNMTARIIKECEEKAAEIIGNAKNEERILLERKVAEAEEKKNEILKKAEIEGSNKKERLISNAHLQVRNRKLEAKQEVIQKVYEKALEVLNKLPKDEYLSFVKNRLLTLNIDGDEEIILSSIDNFIDETFLKEINTELNKMGKNGSLKIGEERRNFKGGFILYKNGIELNNTFEGLILSIEDELEPSIIETVFS
ncbi:V-type ATP synthase subunit E family protein [Clostridium malenominatum]|uniref:V-type proton ATPase subunit E n=1 Tax=Clostridium malenominatum TaxID=1539 RepID=A0ABP3U3X5_9CLOT